MREANLRRLVAVTLVCVGAASIASAGLGAPEIDPGSGVNALALLAAGVIILRGRRKN